MKNLSRQQCNNLSLEEVANILGSDIEVAKAALFFLDEQGVLQKDMHVFCNACSAENVVACDGFENSFIICHECNRKINVKTAETGAFERYSIIKKALEELVKHEYSDIYLKCKDESKIIDFEPKIVRNNLEVENNQIDIVEKEHSELEKDVTILKERVKDHDINKYIIKLTVASGILIVLTIFISFDVVDSFLLKDKKPFIFVLLMKGLKGTALNNYFSDIYVLLVGIIVSILGPIYICCMKSMIKTIRKIKTFIAEGKIIS